MVERLLATHFQAAVNETDHLRCITLALTSSRGRWRSLLLSDQQHLHQQEGDASCACGGRVQDFVTSLSVIARGSVDDKLRWTFNLYDVDGDGVISRSEMTTIVSSIYGLMGRYTSPAISGSTVHQHVDRIFEARQLTAPSRHIRSVRHHFETPR